MALIKAAGKGQWREAFQAACDALKYNPWEAATLHRAGRRVPANRQPRVGNLF